MLRIEIDTSNAAFGDGPNALAVESAACLNRVRRDLFNGDRKGAIMDTNGNRVGHFTLTDAADGEKE